jgi:hypothetical protein
MARIRYSFRKVALVDRQQLVADELGAPAAQANTGDAKEESCREHDRIPIHHGVHPSRRERPVLACPQSHQGSHNEALQANGKEKLAATAAPVQLFNLVWG